MRENLTAEQLNVLKTQLITKKVSLQSQLADFADKNQNLKNDYKTKFEQIGDDKEENTDEVINYTNQLALEHKLEETLMAIEKALSKIDKGTYGQCEKCELSIELARLQALPEAALCINCGQ